MAELPNNTETIDLSNKSNYQKKTYRDEIKRNVFSLDTSAPTIYANNEETANEEISYLNNEKKKGIMNKVKNIFTKKTKKTKKTRKHKGIVQTGGNKGKLRKGYKYTGKKLKNGMAEIKKVKSKK